MTKDYKDYKKTGTTTVGIVCRDGIILAADKRATAGYLIVSKKTDKIEKITDRMAVTTAGTVSDIQLLIKIIKAQLKLHFMRCGIELGVKESANFLSNLVYGNIRKMSMIPGVSHFLFGGVDNTGFYLYDIFPDGSITDVDDFIASGSGSVFAFGVLDADYKHNLSVEEGVKLAVKAVNSAMQRDIASGEGIDVITITPKDGVKKVFAKKLETTITA